MISVLMPIYNGIEYINDSVSSVIDQTYKDWELIIGINGLHEDSIEYKIALEYSSLDNRIKVLNLHNIKGKSNTLNEMIKHCKYDWVAILDVDDIWLPTKLEKQIKYLEDYDVVGSLCVYFENLYGIYFENLYGIIPKIPVGDISDFDFISVNPMINSSAVLRKNIAYWDNEFEGVEDYHLWMKLHKQNKKFFNVDEVLVKHRIHQTSAFNSKNHDDKIKKIREMV